MLKTIVLYTARMGRYAFFNTGLEYKFAFTIQNSSDIILFGGRLNNMGPSMKWTVDDIPHIEKILANLYDFYGMLPFDDSPFDTSLDGTYDLKNSFEKNIKNYQEESKEIVYRILLGHLILHQLSYTRDLTCSFEV
jgi:hypothetical protein